MSDTIIVCKDEALVEELNEATPDNVKVVGLVGAGHLQNAEATFLLQAHEYQLAPCRAYVEGLGKKTRRRGQRQAYNNY